MATLLVRHLFWRVSRTLTDSNPQFTRYKQRDMVMAANCAAKAIAKFLPQAGVRNIAMRLEAGTRQSIALIPSSRIKDFAGVGATDDLQGMALQDLPRNRGALGTTPGRPIPVADRQRTDLGSPDWHSETGAFVRQYFYNPQDPYTFWVSPGVPSTGDQVWVEASIVAVPKAIPQAASDTAGSETYRYDGGSTQTLPIDDLFEDEVWNYICAYLLMGNSKSTNALNRAVAHAQAFTSSLNTLVNQYTGHNPNLKTLPFAPEVPGAAS